MKRNFLLVFVLSILIVNCREKAADPSVPSTEDHAQHEHAAPAAGEAQGAKKPLSPRTSAMANIGDAHIHIDYSSPGVRGRTIWGGLVAYDQVWVTGAHKATAISFNQDLRIDGKRIPAGTYGFFTIPGKDEWVIILNKNFEQHLADDYDQTQDVLRLTVKPEKLAEPVESLTYEVKPDGNKKGNISVSWEYVKISFAVETW